MKLYIPDIGDVLKLIESWTINLHHERRNELLLNEFGHNVDCSYKMADISTKVTFPVGTELKVDKIYIKKGSADYSSLTFKVHKWTKSKTKFQFWAKLKDVNRIVIESSASLGVIRLPINWGYSDLLEKGYNFDVHKNKVNNDLCGKVNSRDAFRITVSDYKISKKINSYKREVDYVEYVKYKLECVITGTVIGEWTTISTMKTKAKKYVDENKKLYLDEEQKMALREEKLERICNENTL